MLFIYSYLFSFFRNVIELGCGLGLLGLVVCSRFSCGSYVLTDHHPSVGTNLGLLHLVL